MALSVIEQLVLWAPPVVMLLVTIGYYVRWGKEADEQTDQTEQPSRSSTGGER